MSIADWTTISDTTTYLPVPSENELLSRFIRNRGRPFFQPQARDAWLCLLDNNNLRLQGKTGSGEKGFFERVNCELLDSVDIVSSQLNMLKFRAFLFADRFLDAAELLMNDDPSSPSFMEMTVVSAILFQTDSGINEKAHAVLKSSGIAFFEVQQYDLGGILFRVGRLDRIAVGYLMDYGQDELAMRFVRSCLDGDDKRRFVFRFGCKRLEAKEFSDSIAYFACANEFHPVLSVLFYMGMVSDCYFLMKYLQKRDLLKPVPEALARFLPEKLTDLDELCGMIEDLFAKLLVRLDISPSEVKVE
jgi:hypothetical protein